VAQVELSFSVEQRFFDVLLEDVSFECSVVVLLLALENAFYLVELETYDNTIASI